MDHEKPKPPSAPARVSERDDVHVVANRCPFCHDAVSLAEDDWVSCRSCQARHHTACWQEAGACSSCGEGRFLSEAPAPNPSEHSLPTEAPRSGLEYSWVEALERAPAVFRSRVPASARSRFLITTVLAVLSLAVGLGSWIEGGHDGAFAYAFAAVAALAALANALRVQTSMILGSSLVLYGGSCVLFANWIDHIRDRHEEAIQIGLGMIALGILTGVTGYLTAYAERGEEPED